MVRNYIILYLLSVVLLMIVATVRMAPAIQNDIEDRAKKVISDGAYDVILASVHGRNVSISGAVADQESATQLVEGISSLKGVGSVDRQFVISPEMPLVISKSAGKLTFRGIVPEYRARDFLVSYARDVYRKANVRDETVVRSGEADLTWPNMVRTIIEESQNFETVEFLISGRVVSIRRSDSLDADGVQSLRNRLEAGFVLIDETEASGISNGRQCTDMLSEITTSGSIAFASGTAELSPEAVGAIQRIAKIMSTCSEDRFLIVGHTDASGSETSNVRLSRSRAAAVVASLEKIGVDSSRLQYDGRGSSEPVADNETPEGKAKNRRIEFIRLD